MTTLYEIAESHKMSVLYLRNLCSRAGIRGKINFRAQFDDKQVAQIEKLIAAKRPLGRPKKAKP